MHTVSRDFSFCYGHRLLNHEGKCAHLHGHNAKVRVELSADVLDDDGMVLDFGELKRAVGEWLESELDHRTFLAENDPLVLPLCDAGEPLVLFPQNPTAENLAEFIFTKIASFGFPVAKVSFWETEKCFASYFERNYFE
ncbi:MAG TPA: 6-carboxytetrahydropterin synthase QueD [Planctomycetaceae bacterium]|nr:6-carboxytetrahydropterin synthase QueD [Planctomycetaceae bacterium]